MACWTAHATAIVNAISKKSFETGILRRCLQKSPAFRSQQSAATRQQSQVCFENSLNVSFSFLLSHPPPFLYLSCASPLALTSFCIVCLPLLPTLKVRNLCLAQTLEFFISLLAVWTSNYSVRTLVFGQHSDLIPTAMCVCVCVHV